MRDAAEEFFNYQITDAISTLEPDVAPPLVPISRSRTVEGRCG